MFCKQSCFSFIDIVILIWDYFMFNLLWSLYISIYKMVLLQESKYLEICCMFCIKNVQNILESMVHIIE